MRYLIAALLVAGAMGGCILIGIVQSHGTYIVIPANITENRQSDINIDWEITIYGISNGFYVKYQGHNPSKAKLKMSETYIFKVDSLTEIRPTPGEMEAK